MKLLIVNFHYYGDEIFNAGIYPVSPNFFQRQLKAIAEEYTFISQIELANYIQENSYPEGNYCLLTFDDGLKQQMHAYQWLVENNIPAIFYVPTKPILESVVLDVHKLHNVRAQIDDKDLIKILKDNGSYQYTSADTQQAEGQYKYDDNLAREIKYQLNFKLSGEAKSEFINNSFKRLYPDEKKFSKNFYMNVHDIQQIANLNMLGSHGHAHIPLAQSTNPKDDMLKSINYLEQLTNKPVVSFSYPYGSKAATNERVATNLENTSIRFALTMWRGINDFDESINPLLLKRVDTNDAPGGKSNIINLSF
jgi:peptidoglycan/xylan/chitin deacetylase (PgdA/CDA1 family)